MMRKSDVFVYYLSICLVLLAAISGEVFLFLASFFFHIYILLYLDNDDR